MEIILYVFATLLVIIGVAGTVLPALPGAPLVFIGLLLAAWTNNFEFVSGVTITVLAVLTVASLLIDFIAGASGAKKVGASKYALIGSVIGTIVGLAGGIFGLLLGPFIGAALGELYATSNLLKAGKVGLATWMGLLIGTILKLGVVFAMVGIFIGALFF